MCALTVKTVWVLLYTEVMCALTAKTIWVLLYT